MANLRFSVLIVFLMGSSVLAGDWARFRGPNGSGVAAESESIPTTWSPSANLAWKTPLPGPGVSCPIIVGGKVFVTCYSGYGLDQENPGEIENLMRHLVCCDLETGEKLWQQDFKATLPEDPYSGIGVTAHGYASHTPVSDGENVYAFFGKGGVYAFDLDGNQLWHAEVGKESDPNKWGSSSSPVLYQNILIVTASAESQAIIGFDTSTGKEVWRQEATGLDNMWGTPALVEIDKNRTDLVMCVARELWGLDPNSGQLRWYAEATAAEQSYASVVMDGNRIFAITGRGGGSVAIDAGGKGNVSQTNTVWTGSETASFASPVRHGSKLYFVSRNIVTVIDAKTGDRVDQARLRGALTTGGRFGSLDYPSPIVVGDQLFYLNGSGQMYVFDLQDGLKPVAVNRVTMDKEMFGGTPAVSDGRLVMRSSKNLYCVTDKGEIVEPSAVAVAEDEDETEADTGSRESGSGGRGNQRFDPMSMFNLRDANKDGKLTAEELGNGPMTERMMTLDKDGDKAISQEEFRTGISSLFSGGRGGGGRGGYGNQRTDNRPQRPQRPKMAGE